MFRLRPAVRALLFETAEDYEDELKGGGDGVLDSGFSHGEIRDDVEEREAFLNHLDDEIEKAERKARMHFREALESEGAEKLRHYRKANGYKTYRDGFQEVSDQVANSQQSLAVMDVEAIKEKMAQQVSDLGFNIDVTEMPVDEISASIEDNRFENREKGRVRDQLERSQNVAKDVEAPYQDLMSEGESVEAEEIQREVDELSGSGQSQRDEELDEQIRQDLEDL